MKSIINPRSKTQWAAAAVTFFGLVYDELPKLREYIPPEYYGDIFIIVGLVFMALRAVTSQPLSEK